MSKINIDKGDLLVTDNGNGIIYFEHCPLEEEGYSSEGKIEVKFDSDGFVIDSEIVDCRYWFNCEPTDWNLIDKEYNDLLVEKVLIACGY